MSEQHEEQHGHHTLPGKNVTYFIQLGPEADFVMPGEAGHRQGSLGDDVLPGLHTGGYNPLLQPPSLDIEMENRPRRNVLCVSVISNSSSFCYNSHVTISSQINVNSKYNLDLQFLFDVDN